MLISGSGTNLQALIDAARAPDYPGRVAVVISNRADAHGLRRAEAAGIPALCISHRQRSREDFERELIAVLQAHRVQWVALAGFMRVLTPCFLDAFPQRVLNIHPSLLPAFPGLDAQGQAIAHGVRITGATVHLVDVGVATGPILPQGALSVAVGESRESLRQRLLVLEHQLYPRALALALSGQLQLGGSQRDSPADEAGLVSP